MKSFNYLIGTLAIFTTACTSSNQVAKTNTDDVYFSSKDAQINDVQNKKIDNEKTNPANYTGKQEQQNTNANEDYYDPNVKSNSSNSNSNSYITNNYNNSSFDYDDYYDYAYSSRLRRFHNTSNYWGYYDPFYTNTYYYNYQPGCWGTSIYSSYNFWYPSATIMIGNPYTYNPWMQSNLYPYWYYNDPWMNYGYNPYYGYGSYFNGYNNGYWAGYNNGYYSGYYGGNYYNYNSFENKNRHYGPRNSNASNGTGNRGRNNDSFGEKYEKRIVADNGSNPEIKNNTIESAPIKKNTETKPENSEVKNNSFGVNPSNPIKRTEENIGKNPRIESLPNEGRPNNNTYPIKTSEPTRPNEELNPKNNWNSGTIKGNEPKPNFEKNVDEGRPKNNPNGNSPSPRIEENNAPRKNNYNRKEEAAPKIERNNDQGRPRRNTYEGRSVNEDKSNSQPNRFEQRSTLEQPKQDYRGNNERYSAPAPRENNTGGGGRRR